MQFNSYIFILSFLPAFVLCYFLLSRIHPLAGKAAVIAFGVWFYGYCGLNPAIILGISLVINLLFSLALSKLTRFRKSVLAFAVAANAGLLFYFKYAGFAADVIRQLFGTNLRTGEPILLLGISFFTFQQIMYVVSVYRKTIQRVNIPDYLCYALFFPKLIMGPLMEPADFIKQLNDPERKKIRWENLAGGIKLFGFGLFKKMVLADTFARGVAWGYDNLAAATSGDLFLVMLFYAFEIYFDFSGYSDMATGVSGMVNITLPINFDSPYKAVSMRDFWKRWHVSLSAFLKNYIYIPLGGNRKGIVRTCLHIMLIFFISGLWHGANWTFILWGCLHGLFVVLERIFEKPLKRLQGPFMWLYTFFAVSLLWLLFRSESVSQWAELLGRMFAFQDMAVSDGLIKSFVLPETTLIMDSLDFLNLNTLVRGFPIAIMTAGAFLLCLIPENNYRNHHKLSVVNMFLCAAAFVWAFLCLSSESVFIYAGF